MRTQLSIILWFVFQLGFSQQRTPTELADLQLKGYNERNIDLFLEAYSDSVKVFNFPDKLLYTGKEIMRKGYADMFANLPDLHCTIKSRMVIGNTVIDEESVLFTKGQPLLHAIAIYKIEQGKIQEVYFITNR
ncbi:MAG: nuclear transport factor 2 family protein [Cyclobacteriaceae bacterium]|nr:nuclear transport factor 2 family protein [Cyclobacteriaceae bacterium]